MGVLAAAIDDMATKYVSSGYATLLDLVVILDAMALALAICVTIGRGYFALARDGLLPAVFAKTSRYNTPWVGNLMVIVGGVGLMLLVKTANYFAQFVIPGRTATRSRCSRTTSSRPSSWPRRSARSPSSSST